LATQYFFNASDIHERQRLSDLVGQLSRDCHRVYARRPGHLDCLHAHHGRKDAHDDENNDGNQGQCSSSPCLATAADPRRESANLIAFESFAGLAGLAQSMPCVCGVFSVSTGGTRFAGLSPISAR
jgi:hypothetical protein